MIIIFIWYFWICVLPSFNSYSVSVLQLPNLLGFKTVDHSKFSRRLLRLWIIARAINRSRSRSVNRTESIPFGVAYQKSRDDAIWSGATPKDPRESNEIVTGWNLVFDFD